MTYSREGVKYNDENCIYLNGNECTDGSRRLVVDEDTGIATIYKRISGVWQPTSFETGPNSLWVGRNVGLAGVGHHLATEASDGHLHFHAHGEFNGEISQIDARMVNAYQYFERLVMQSDDSGNWVGTSWESTSMAFARTISEKIYFKTGTVAATAPIRFRVWEGINDTGPLIFDQTYPTSDFPASTEIELDLRGYLEYAPGNNYCNIISSAADFSLNANAAVDSIWIAADLSFIREESMLQTMDWESGGTYAEGQYLIADRKIYICNTPGTQTGTFENNSDKWYTSDSAPSLPWETVVADRTITIPENRQMPVFGTFTIDGIANLNGTLVIRS